MKSPNTIFKADRQSSCLRFKILLCGRPHWGAVGGKMKEKIVLECKDKNYDFRFLGSINPRFDAGNIQTVSIKGTNYCFFSVSFPEKEGIYLWILNNEIQYIGNSVNINKQFNTGFGKISKRNCENDGQSTNCRLNNAVYSEFLHKNKFDIYFCEIENSKSCKKLLVSQYSTKYNIKRG